MPVGIRGRATMARRWRTAGRWALVGAVVIALHLIVLGWLGRLPAPAEILDAARIVEARLLAPPAPPAPVKTTPPRKPAAQHPAAEPAPQPEPPLATVPSGVDTAAPGSGEPQATSAPPGPTPVRPAGAPDDAAHFALPPSTSLRYDTYVNGIRNQNGTLRWVTDGNQYTMEVETSIPFLGRYAFQSTGHIDGYGLAPDRYTEIRGRRDPATATFGRGTPPAATPTVTFSRNSASVALTPGVQDRFSVFMQMVGLLRGAAQRYATPGDTLPFQVVDTRDAEAIRVQFVGEENVAVAGGRNVQARHFVRLPRHAGDRRVVEVWLAESLGWMPARLRQTEPNGLQFELVWQGTE